MNRTKKTVTALLLTLTYIISMLTPACARYATLFETSVSLTISSTGCASCNASVEANSSVYTVSVDMALYRESTMVKSWSSSSGASVELNKSYYVTKGHDYHVEINVTVKNASGTILETTTVCSDICTY